MRDEDTVIRTPHDEIVSRVDGKTHREKRDPRTSVTMRDRGCKLVVFFDDGGREGPVSELRLLPDTEELAPHVLRQFLPQAPLYVQYARAVMTNRDDDWRSYSEALREIGATRRGLPPEHYRNIADRYAALLAEGERYPVKALAEMQHVSISAASRWITEARRRGLIEEKS